MIRFKSYLVRVFRKEYCEISVTAENADVAAEYALHGESPDWEVDSVEEVLEELKDTEAPDSASGASG